MNIFKQLAAFFSKLTGPKPNPPLPKVSPQKASPEKAPQPTPQVQLVPGELLVEFEDPPADGGLWYDSSSYATHLYAIDLTTVSCSCPDFKKGREIYPIRDVRRYCKHLLSVGNEAGFCKKLNIENELIDYAMRGNHSLAVRSRMFLKQIDENELFIVQDGVSGWFNMYTRKNRSTDTTKCTGEIDRFGYNLESNRWGYGDAPFQPMKIKDFVRTLPQWKTTVPDLPSDETELSLDQIQVLPVGTHLTLSVSSLVISRLREETNPDAIVKNLSVLSHSINLDRKEIAATCIEHAKNMANYSTHLAAEILDLALIAAADCGAEQLKKDFGPIYSDPSRADLKIKSLNEARAELEEQKRVTSRELIDIASEKKGFEALGDLKEKTQADSLYKANGRFGGATAYPDFVKKLVSRRAVDKRSQQTNAILDYMASLAIWSKEIHLGAVADMLKVKGLIRQKEGDKEQALLYFKHAIALKKNVGVTKTIRQLKKELGLSQ